MTEMVDLILKAAEDQNLHHLKNKGGDQFISDCQWIINEYCGIKV